MLYKILNSMRTVNSRKTTSFALGNYQSYPTKSRPVFIQSLRTRVVSAYV